MYILYYLLIINRCKISANCDLYLIHSIKWISKFNHDPLKRIRFLSEIEILYNFHHNLLEIFANNFYNVEMTMITL